MGRSAESVQLRGNGISIGQIWVKIQYGDGFSAEKTLVCLGIPSQSKNQFEIHCVASIHGRCVFGASESLQAQILLGKERHSISTSLLVLPRKTALCLCVNIYMGQFKMYIFYSTEKGQSLPPEGRFRRPWTDPDQPIQSACT